MLLYSAPQPWHPEALPFINHSLNHYFGKDSEGKQKPWNFNHTGDRHHGQDRPLGQSKVLSRMNRERPRLPTAMYDVSAV